MVRVKFSCSSHVSTCSGKLVYDTPITRPVFVTFCCRKFLDISLYGSTSSTYAYHIFHVFFKRAASTTTGTPNTYSLSKASWLEIMAGKKTKQSKAGQPNERAANLLNKNSVDVKFPKTVTISPFSVDMYQVPIHPDNDPKQPPTMRTVLHIQPELPWASLAKYRNFTRMSVLLPSLSSDRIHRNPTLICLTRAQ